MVLPSSLFTAIGIISIALQSVSIGSLIASEKTRIEWPNGEKSPAVCVGKSSWFFAVPPASVDLEKGAEMQLHLSGESFGVKLLHFNSKSRLCLFESASPKHVGEPVTISRTRDLGAGDKLQCLTGSGKCSSIVAGKEWAYRGVNFESPLLHLRLADEAVRCPPGTPLINEKGELEGIVCVRQTTLEDEVFAIPASRINKLVKDFKQYRKTGPVWLGLLFHVGSSSPEVMKVKADSPASKAGIEAGDVILEVNQLPIENLDDLVEALHSLPAGEEAGVTLLRGVDETSVQLVPQFATTNVAEN